VTHRAAALTLSAMLIAVLSLPSALATADSFTPVTLSIRATPVARLRVVFPVRVTVSADPGVLDTSEGPMRIEVKLAGECGGNFQTTPGTTLLNKQLQPQPATGRAYSATAAGSGRPKAYGSQTLCVFLQDTDAGRVYANDESNQVDVSRPCTVSARRYDSAQRQLRRAQRQLRRTRRRAARRRLQRTIATRKRTLNRDRRQARAVCGPGVAL
jgi:hypothetical protein